MTLYILRYGLKCSIQSKDADVSLFLLFLCLLKDSELICCVLFGGGTDRRQYTKGKELQGTITVPRYPCDTENKLQSVQKSSRWVFLCMSTSMWALRSGLNGTQFSLRVLVTRFLVSAGISIMSELSASWLSI